MQQEWNRPVIVPLYLFVIALVLLAFGLYAAYRKRQSAVIVKKET
jgi:hypothetical protein